MVNQPYIKVQVKQRVLPLKSIFKYPLMVLSLKGEKALKIQF